MSMIVEEQLREALKKQTELYEWAVRELKKASTEVESFKASVADRHAKVVEIEAALERLGYK
jgi:hypothetical protein